MYRFLLFLAVLPVAAADFTGDLYHHLAAGNGNLVFSPLSVSTALAMTLHGARGQTAREIQAVLRTPPDAALLEQIARSGNLSGDQLSLAQALWVDRGFALQPDFVRANEQQFHAPPRTANFSHAPDEARLTVNRWVEEQTRGKIADLFGPGSLTRDTRLVLASAIYFNGKWKQKFDPAVTAPAPFHPSGGAPSDVPFLNQTARFPYAETASAQALELPYADASLAFDVVLPKAGVTLGSLEKDFQTNGLPAWTAHLQGRQVVVSLPKFRAESSFSLQAALTAMGMGNAFTNTADFSGIDGHRDLAISQVAHKAYLDVSEEGAEAAAATGIAVQRMAMMQPTVFRADHPFLFFLRDTRTGAVLFAGRLDDPRR